MITGLILSVFAATQPAAAEGWTWSLYGAGEGGTVVLANEIPDTPELRATLECEPGSGAARISVFGVEGAADGYVSIRSGDAAATSQGDTGRDGGVRRLSASLRLEHPVFHAFSSSGNLVMSQEDRSWPIRLGRHHRALLTEFAAACEG